MFLLASCVFFTLTYRDSALPCSVTFEDEFNNVYGVFRMPKACKIAADKGMVCKSTAYVYDIQNFIKRMRTDYERKHSCKLDMKYFVCAEYGPNPNGTKRPHYHGVLMTSAVYNDLLPYFNQWKVDFGRIDFVEVGVQREDKSSVANYVSKYCAKGCFESRAEDIAHKHISRAFSVMSKNIGSRWLAEHSRDYLSRVPSLVSVDGDWTIEDIDKFYHATIECGYYNLSALVGSKYEHPIWKEVDNLIENMRIYDGNNFSYRMPRYYRDRLFSIKKTFINYDTNSSHLSLCIAPVWFSVIFILVQDFIDNHQKNKSIKKCHFFPRLSLPGNRMKEKTRVMFARIFYPLRLRIAYNCSLLLALSKTPKSTKVRYTTVTKMVSFIVGLKMINALLLRLVEKSLNHRCEISIHPICGKTEI